jgi:hypothetical protein
MSLYFKALKYTVKAFENIEKVKNRKFNYTERAMVGFLTVSF